MDAPQKTAQADTEEDQVHHPNVDRWFAFCHKLLDWLTHCQIGVQYYSSGTMSVWCTRMQTCVTVTWQTHSASAVLHELFFVTIGYSMTACPLLFLLLPEQALHVFSRSTGKHVNLLEQFDICVCCPSPCKLLSGPTPTDAYLPSCIICIVAVVLTCMVPQGNRSC